MKLQHMTKGLLGLAAVAMLATSAPAAIYTTADGAGADAELRESQPTTARGTGTEIASRISGAGGRNSIIYLKFDVANITPYELANDITVRTTVRNNNLSSGRIENPFVSNGATAGFDYFVMDPTIAPGTDAEQGTTTDPFDNQGADWDEATITPTNAPAYDFDGDFYTKATGTIGTPTQGLTYLGSQSFDPNDIGANGWIPIGTPFTLTTLPPNSPLHQAIVAAQGTAHQTVTVVMGVSHAADHPVSGWLNFNYLFNPKEYTDVINDSSSPWDGLARTANPFAPALVTVPEPTTIALMGMAGLGLMAARRRR
ncbi:MAG: hypothetical protein CMJ58_03580 [Planctomycetaceae bacterium]|nr:hypothetical protein [Planctomycetaceae bacterium]